MSSFTYPVDKKSNPYDNTATPPQAGASRAPAVASSSRQAENDTYDPPPSDAPPSYNQTRALPRIPNQLPPNSYKVPFQPVPFDISTCSKAKNAVFASNQNVPSLTNILGTYVDRKVQNETRRQMRGVVGTYANSAPEVQMYNHIMHKLETLSLNVVRDRRGDRNNWVQAVGQFRREQFAELYNANGMVRAFAKELPGGPLALPPLDQHALGRREGWPYPRSTYRAPNLRAPFTLLAGVRTVVLLDDSTSMLQPGHPSWSEGGYAYNNYNSYNGYNSYSRSYNYGNSRGYNEMNLGASSISRWQQSKKLLSQLAPKVAEYSHHGIDVYLLNRQTAYLNCRTASDVKRVFDAGGPNGLTYTGQRVNEILDGYMSTLRYDRRMQPLHLIVITDGMSDDTWMLHWSIEEHVTKLMQRGYPAHQVGIEFLQVGDCPVATRHLFELEEEVSRHHMSFQRDVVGVTPAPYITNMNADQLLAICVSGIDARTNGYMRRRGINY